MQNLNWVGWVIAGLSLTAHLIKFARDRRQGVTVRAESGPNVKVALPGDARRPRAPMMVAKRRATASEVRTKVRVYVTATSPITVVDAAVCQFRWLLLRRLGSCSEKIAKPVGVSADAREKSIVLTLENSQVLGSAPWVRVRTERGHHYYTRVKLLNGNE
ncbi:hypothetical protein [Glycomyces salinus]|uniref:hypothetical protein n=1 Tax=Glycomyces salinus TaxID=980294 RepID=UPI0018ECB3C7|nr:hypothetical protein [Glycomyces salinus]